MSRRMRRITGWFLSLLLIFTVLPIGQVKRAFANPSPFTVDNLSNDYSNPTQNNQGTVTISGSYNATGIDPKTIAVTINQVVVPSGSGNPVVVSTVNSPVSPVTTSVAQDQGTYTFSGVQLSSGLNQIVITAKTTAGVAISSASTNYGYVNYVNSPALLNFKLLDGTAFDDVVYINQKPGDQNAFSFSLQGFNVNQVTVSSSASGSVVQATQAAGSTTFYAYNVPLQFGQNTITVVGKNDTTSISYTRKVVYYSQQFEFNTGANVTNGSYTKFYPFTYNPTGAAAPTPSILSDSNFSSSNITSAPITGQFVVSNSIANPVVTLTISNLDGSNPATVTLTPTLQSNNGNSVLYSFSSSSVSGPTPLLLQPPGSTAVAGGYALTPNQVYKVAFHVTSGGSTVGTDNTYTFQYIDPTAKYPLGVSNLTGSMASGVFTVQNATSINPSVADNILNLPQAYGLKYGNVTFNSSYNYSNVQVDYDGSTILDPKFYQVGYDTGNSYLVINFQRDPATQLPPFTGVHTITVYADKNDPTTAQTFKVNYVSTPMIQVTNISNNQVLDPTVSLSDIEAHLFNFSSTDIKNLTVSLNGKAISGPPFTLDATTGLYKFVPTNPADLKLNNGQNTLVIAGNSTSADGTSIPVSVTITIYQFTNSPAGITLTGPIAYSNKGVQSPSTLPAIKKNSDGTDQLDNQNYQLTGNTYVTGNDYAIFKGTFQSNQSFNIQVNGKSILPIEPSLPPGVNANDPNWYISSIGGNTNTNLLTAANPPTDANHDMSYAKDGSSFVWFVPNLNGTTSDVYVALQLPASGSINLSFVADNGNTSQNVVVTRQVLPYSIVYPVGGQDFVNKNFYDVELEAPIGSTVLINKLSTSLKAPKDGDSSKSDYHVIVPLKTGANVIPFTVTTGNQTSKGTVTINNANQNVVGAEYLAPLGTSGTLTAFNGALTLKFPRNTVFQSAPISGQVNTGEPTLFNSQKLLMGIADPSTGFLEYQYDPNTNSQIAFNGVDGGVNQASGPGLIQSLRNLGYNVVDNLYWIDHGYYDTTAHDGIQPYYKNDEFYLRTDSLKLFPTQPGTLAIQYDPTMRDAVSTTLAVMHFSVNNNGSNWVDLGGTVNLSNHSITVPYTDPGYYTVVYLRHGYQDIVNSSWARNYMDTALAKGLMLPYQLGSLFGADLSITRGEWSEVMVKSLGMPLNYDPNNPTFIDLPTSVVPGALWDYRYVETAARKGIIRGMGDGAFQPDAYVERQDAAVMMARAMNLKVPTDAQYPQTLASLRKMYTDADSISPYAAGAVLTIAKLGIMQGNPNTVSAGAKQTYNFAPTANMRRDEASAMAYRVLQQLGKLPK